MLSTTGNTLLNPTKKVVTLQKVTTLSFLYARGSLSEGYHFRPELRLHKILYTALYNLTQFSLHYHKVSFYNSVIETSEYPAFSTTLVTLNFVPLSNST